MIAFAKLRPSQTTHPTCRAADWFALQPGEDRSGIVRTIAVGRWSDPGQIRPRRDNIDQDASKTEESLPEALVFDLTLVPAVRKRLAKIENCVGPVIIDWHGMPYDRFAWSDLVRKHRESGWRP